jgi:Bacterial membrane protein YfhO
MLCKYFLNNCAFQHKTFNLLPKEKLSMKKFNFKILVPHIVAFFTFLLLSLIFTKPVFDGKVIEQYDSHQWRASAQQSFQYKDTHGHFPRWTNSMFGGMPAYQIAMDDKTSSIISITSFLDIFTLGLPKPVYFLFIACACFYFLCIVIGVNPWLSILGGIAYGYCSYIPILIIVGHDTKLLAMAYAPAILASMLLVFNKKYWIGGSLLLIFSACFIAQSHQQILYYTLIIALCLTAYFVIKTIKQKDYRHLIISLLVISILSTISLLICSVGYFATYEYAKESMRGGSALSPTDKTNQIKGGLDKDYAFQWSYGRAENLTFLVPNALGGGSSTSLGDDSKVADVLQNTPNIPQQLTQQLYQAATAYWGEQPGTAGPVYFGAIMVFLFLLGLVVSKSEHKWWILTASIIGILLALGKNFESLNYFLFDHLPFYNKFRTPAMALVIPQLTVPLLGVIFVNELINIKDKARLTLIGKKSLIVAGSITALLILFYFSADFKNEATNELRKNLSDAMQNNSDFVNAYIGAIVKDRQALYLADMWRTLGFLLAGVAVIYLYTKQIIKPAILYTALILLTAIDLVGIDKRYLNDDNFVDPTDYADTYKNYNADNQIDRDPSFFRVLNLAANTGNGFQLSVGNTFNDAIPSYKHNMIGGYSPAKIGIFNDLINKQLYKNIQAWAANPNAKDSFQVLNMLNMKYVIVPDQNDPKQTIAIPNRFALGNCWLVKEIRYVDNADDEMNALDSIDPANTAIIDKSFKGIIPFGPFQDSSAYIRLIKNDNDDITYDFNSSANQFAVFSEIYYSKGWEAYIDQKQVDYCKVDYVLRGLAIPAGKHSIEFKFDSKFVALGESLAKFANIFAWGFLLLSCFMIWKNGKKDKEDAS